MRKVLLVAATSITLLVVPAGGTFGDEHSSDPVVAEPEQTTTEPGAETPEAPPGETCDVLVEQPELNVFRTASLFITACEDGRASFFKTDDETANARNSITVGAGSRTGHALSRGCPGRHRITLGLVHRPRTLSSAPSSKLVVSLRGGGQQARRTVRVFRTANGMTATFVVPAPHLRAARAVFSAAGEGAVPSRVASVRCE